MSTAPSAVNNWNHTSTGLGLPSQHSQVGSSIRSGNAYGVVRNPSILHSESRYDPSNVITRSDLEQQRPSIHRYLDVQASSIHESQLEGDEGASLPSFMDQNYPVPGGVFQQPGHHLSSTQQNPYALE